MANRSKVVKALVDNGWKPNVDYLNDEYSSWYWVVGKSTDEFGRFCTTNNTGQVEYSDYNYLISPNKTHAITVKEDTITIHEAKKKYTKILTFDMIEIIITDIGLQCGMLMLLFND